MPRGKSDKLTFKVYDQGQGELIPPTAEEMIPANHLVRIVSTTLDKLDTKILLKQYKHGGGASRYHPLMLLKVLIYGYLNNVYSSRMLAKSLRENIYFRWLSGCQQPDFHTINSFRKNKISTIIEEIFVELVKYLHKEGYVELKTVYLDGTKIESRANKYTVVWRKAIDYYDKNLEKKVRSLYAEAESIAEQENIEYGDDDLSEMGKSPISSESIKQAAENINNALEKLEKEEVKKN